MNFFLTGSIILVTLGLLTNVAACINVDPSFRTQRNRILLMGENSHGEGNITVCGEFNFHADPEAAKVVIDRANCHVYISPWETSKNINITWVVLGFFFKMLKIRNCDAEFYLN